MNAQSLCFRSHCSAASPNQLTVPRTPSIDCSREDSNRVGKTNTQWAILQT